MLKSGAGADGKHGFLRADIAKALKMNELTTEIFERRNFFNHGKHRKHGKKCKKSGASADGGHGKLRTNIANAQK